MSVLVLQNHKLGSWARNMNLIAVNKFINLKEPTNLSPIPPMSEKKVGMYTPNLDHKRVYIESVMIFIFCHLPYEGNLTQRLYLSPFADEGNHLLPDEGNQWSVETYLLTPG